MNLAVQPRYPAARDTWKAVIPGAGVIAGSVAITRSGSIAATGVITSGSIQGTGVITSSSSMTGGAITGSGLIGGALTRSGLIGSGETITSIESILLGGNLSVPVSIFASTVPGWEEAGLSRLLSVSGQDDARTSETENFQAIENSVRALLESVSSEDLEDGVATRLVPQLAHLVTAYGRGAVLDLAGLIESGSVDPYVASWILRSLGRISHQPSHHARRWLLQRALLSSTPIIRDGAALGLASLRDGRALPALRAAVAREPYARLRRDMEQSLSKLERSV
jgi:hypothetical protein